MMIVKGPRFLSVSFLEGLVVQKYLALTKAWSPILKSDAVVQQPSSHGGTGGGSQD